MITSKKKKKHEFIALGIAEALHPKKKPRRR
jgi:hypothetical protein